MVNKAYVFRILQKVGLMILACLRSVTHVAFRILLTLLKPVWLWLSGLICGAIAGVSIGVVTGVAGFGSAVNGMIVFGPIGASIGFLVGLVVFLSLRNRKLKLHGNKR